MADTITGGNDIGLWALWPVNIPEKIREYWLKYEQVLFDTVMKIIFETWCSTTQKRQKLVMEMYHKSYS